MLQNFTERNVRKPTVSFAFCTHVDVIKYRKTLTFPVLIALSFRSHREGDRKGRHI